MDINAEAFALTIEKWQDVLDTADSHLEENLVSEFLEDLRNLLHG